MAMQHAGSVLHLEARPVPVLIVRPFPALLQVLVAAVLNQHLHPQYFQCVLCRLVYSSTSTCSVHVRTMLMKSVRTFKHLTGNW